MGYTEYVERRSRSERSLAREGLRALTVLSGFVLAMYLATVEKNGRLAFATMGGAIFLAWSM